MSDRTGDPITLMVSVLHYLAELPPAAQTILAVTGTVVLAGLLVYAEYRRRTRTTPTLRARAGTLAARALRAAWTALRTPPTTDQKTKRENAAENLLVFGFVFVVGGLIMQGLIPFARDDMGLTGPWPYLLFFALDGMAAYFGLISYRLAKEGAKATSPRIMVLAIMGGSAWFQWAHADGRDLPARVAWAALPLIAGYLWETTLKYRRRAWKKANTNTGRQVPRARWFWDPAGSLGITRRTHMWNLDTWEEGLETHMTRTECIRQLRREFGLFWSWRVPADVAIRLRRGFKVEEAAARVPEVIATHRREMENRRLVAEARRSVAAAGGVPSGTYTITAPPAPGLDLGPVPGVADVIEPVGPAVTPSGGATVWEDPADAWDPLPGDDGFEWEGPTDDDPVDPWENSVPADAPFTPTPHPTTPRGGSQITPILTPDPDLTPAGFSPSPREGTPEWEEVIRTYIDSVNAGDPMSGRELCRRYNVNPNHKEWRQKVVRTAKGRMADETSGALPLFS